MFAATAYLLPTMTSAQSFDCRRAQDAVDHAICTSSRLRELDTELARTFAAALGRDAAGADAIRHAEQLWAKGRSSCLAGGRSLAQCLTAAYENRIAAVAAAPAPAAVVTAPAASITAATHRNPTTPSPVTATPAPASTTTVAAQLPAVGTPTQAPSVGTRPGAAASDAASLRFAEPRPATGLPALPAAVATLDRTRFPTAGQTGVLLHVMTPGRFAIRAESQSGTALRLVDMLTGPGDQAGWPGKQDGRIDALLDVGTYKVRASGDPVATGDTVLSVTPFIPAAPAQIAPGYLPVAMTLRDFQVQSFWLVVGEATETTRVEAAGRGLAALKLWRDGRDLVEPTEETTIINPTPAHPMTNIVLTGQLRPGTYLITAYGGPPLPWSDGKTDEPLYLRTGRSMDLLAGGVSGHVGVFGTEIFAMPPDAASVLTALPSPADGHLSATVAGAEAASANIAKNDRDAIAFLDLPPVSAKQRVVALRAATGQDFVMRSLPAGGPPPNRGRFWFGVAEPGNGGDEPPAAAILARIHFDPTARHDAPPEVLAAPGVPTIATDKAWRARFNLRGRASLLFEARDVVSVALHTEGPAVTPRIKTPDGALLNASGNGQAATRWDLSPGFYRLELTPPRDAIGILDLTLGPPGLLPPEPEPPGPKMPVLFLGEQQTNAESRLVLLTNDVPGGGSALLSRAVPVELADGPLVQTLPPMTTRSVAVHARVAGILLVRDLAGGAPSTSRPMAAGDTTSVDLSTSDREQTLAIALLPPPLASPDPAPAPRLTELLNDQPVFLDLARYEQASFDLTVAQGGLYRVETTGRLKTKGSIGTAFIPVLADADANGVGANMLLQRYLRAGHYRFDLTAEDSNGRLGVSATATPLAIGADLLPGGSTRASVTPGQGVAFPIRIANAGRYHLDLLGDSRIFSARLEDSEGWPIRATDDLSSINEDLQSGGYRLIIQPPSVQARVVARLRKIEPGVTLTGHGPHVLPFDQPRSLEWREPPGRDDPRAPDVWTFVLAGPAHVALSIDGDGMAALLQAESAKADPPPLGRVMAGTKFVADLPAGRYRAEARALGRNDRLSYSIALHSDELQPATPRKVTLPADLPFAIATPRVVTLTSFGKVPLRGELRDDSGHVLARPSGRTDDWNMALSRSLPAGRYRLVLVPLRPPPGKTTGRDATDENASDDNASDDSVGNAADADNSMTDQPSGDKSGSDNARSDNQNSDDANTDQSDNDDQTGADQMPARTEVTLSLPSDGPEGRLSDAGGARLSGDGIEHVVLPPPPAGALLVAAAEAPVELILALERRAADGAWQTVGLDQGLAPMVAVPVADPAAVWRISAWTVDGGTVPIQVASRAMTRAAAPIGPVPLMPLALDGIRRHWQVALVTDPGAMMLRLSEPDPGLLATSAPDRAAAPLAGGTIVAQSDAVWLLGREPGSPRLEPVRTGAGTMLAIAIPASGRATLPIASPPASTLCAYTAVSGFGQPGLDAGRGMGVAMGGAFALCSGPTLTVWNADGETPLRPRIQRQDLASRSDISVDQAFVGTIGAHSAVKLRLPVGTKRLDVTLAASEALVTGGQPPNAVTVWAGDTPLSRGLTGDWTEATLVNLGDLEAPAALILTQVPRPSGLGPGEIFRRYFGAGGSFVLPLSGKSGQRLALTGEAGATVLFPNGQVRRGNVVPLDGPANVVVMHGAGPLAMWIEGAGASPWPATPSRDVTLPARLTLEQESMALRLSPGAPMLLRLSSTAPAILAIGSGRPVLFGAGVTRERYLPAGETVLRLLSPQDGPLSGTLELAGSPVIEVGEGMSHPVAIAPGGAAVFGFNLNAAAFVGLGVRADPDRVTVRLLDEAGETLQSGVSMLRHLKPGRYLLEVTVPPDAPTALVRPAVLGIVPHPNPPPPDVIRGLLAAAGFAPPDASR